MNRKPRHVVEKPSSPDNRTFAALPLSRKDFLGALSASACAACVSAPERAKPVVRFGFVSDCHYAAHKPTALQCVYSDGLRRVGLFADRMNDLNVDFVVEGGDFKDLGRSRLESLDYLDAIEQAFARFRGPRYHVLGNHDHDNLAKEEFLAHVANEGQPQARAWYAFVRNGITFIVLDACYRPDGKPYCRGAFSWKEAFIPPEEIDFLRNALDEAPGPCVPIVHQQLDAEDETVISNAAEVRAILEASGKVRAVMQGHFHESSFRELNGIGYYTLRACALGAGAREGASALVEVFGDGAVRVHGYGGALSIGLDPDGAWRLAEKWRAGHYQMHAIFTGRGESMLHIFPDGTSMLLDCGDSMRFHGTPQETPHLPDLSRRSGEWVARYVARTNPGGARVDYFHLSHYHEDHGGGERYHGEKIFAPTGDYWLCGLADAARFLTFGTVVDRAWPHFDDPLDVLATSRDGTPRNIRNVYAALEEKGTRIERFRLGARDQFVQRDERLARDDFEIFNLCANGRYVRRDGTVADLYRHLVRRGAKAFNENGMSCGLVVRYGAFAYFTAGDFSDGRPGPDGTREQTEDLLAEAVGPVDVAKCNHHGHHAMFPRLVSALGARVWTACVLDQQHMTDDTMRRLSDRALYPGARTILPTYMPHDRPPDGHGPTPLGDVPRAVRDEPCHVILDVPEGGATYTLTCVSARDETARVKAVYGFLSRAATTPPKKVRA